ncbi:MAG: polysaccharide biosynthesis C-terminal domain-containing protein [Ignavibacteria bacterium]|nr:polysaccharide biosynthesis C-terminal domain-containing protein [Ignavibacteria bacterium]
MISIIKRTHVILLIIAICLIFNFAANIIFIRYAGIYASAIVTVFSAVLMVLTGYYLTKKFTFTKFETGKIILLSAIFLGVVCLSFFLFPAECLFRYYY